MRSFLQGLSIALTLASLAPAAAHASPESIRHGEHRSFDTPVADDSHSAEDGPEGHRLLVQINGMANESLHFGGTIEARVWNGLHLGPTGFVHVRNEGYGFMGLRTSYRFQPVADVLVGPYFAAGGVKAGVASNEYGDIEARNGATVTFGGTLGYTMGPVLFGLEGGVMPVSVRRTDGLYVAAPHPPEESTEWIAMMSLMVGVRL